MHVFVKAASTENFVVEGDWLRSEELLWLAQCTVQLFDFVCLCVKAVSVGYPALIPAVYQYFTLADGEAAHCIPACPLAVLVREVEQFPSLVGGVCEAVKPLDGVERCLCHTVAAADHIQVSLVNNAHRVVVPANVEVADFCPQIFADVENLSFFSRIVGVPTTHGVDEVFCQVFESSIEVR